MQNDSDCAGSNIMMDANTLFPLGYHPVNHDFLPDNSGLAPYGSRALASVKYYYIDFGISSYLPPHVHPKLVVGRFGRDQHVPELSDNIPYDPFKVDICIIGNLLFDQFVEV